jgi:Uncharacterized protein conserved in bacteria (DUF2200)
VGDVADPLMQKIRYLDKLIDELAKGKKMARRASYGSSRARRRGSGSGVPAHPCRPYGKVTRPERLRLAQATGARWVLGWTPTIL